MKTFPAAYGILTLLFLAAPLLLLAQEAMIKGIVMDQETGEPIEFSSISLEETSWGAASDDKGYYFILDIQAGIYEIRVTSMGYETLSREITVTAGATLNLSFSLAKTSYSLNEVAVSAARSRSRTQIKISEIEVLPADISRLPSFGSMPDLAQHLQSLAGVISTGDVGGQLYVRGGSPVQNKVLLDGAIIYNPFHSSGLYSVFDIDAIRKTEIYTGGFGAEYGGSLSSVMDVTTRYGNINRFAGKVDVSTLGSKVLLEGPAFRPKPGSKSHASFLTYYRTSYFDRAAQSIYSYVNKELPFSFHDFYGKFSLFSGEVFKANLYGFSFNDRSGNENTAFEYTWKNRGFGANFFIAPPQNSTLIHAFFAVSGFGMQLTETTYVPRESQVNAVNLGIRINNYFGSHTMKYGLEVLTLKTDYLYYTTSFNDTEQFNNTSEVSGYVTFFGNYNKLLIKPGLRLNIYSALNKLSFEPRLSMKYLVTDWLRLKLAAGIYTQNLISATSDRDIINFFRGYVSAPVNMVSTTSAWQSSYLLQEAYHMILGTEFEPWPRLFVNLEIYYKDYPQLINFNRDKLFNAYDHPEQPQILTRDFILESGYSRGLETTIDYKSARYSISLVYSLSKTERTFTGKDNASFTYSPHFDRRHNINLLGNIVLSRDKSWQFNFRWNFGSGFPFTPAIGYVESNSMDPLQIQNFLTQNGSLDIYYGAYNSQRLPAYQRLDMGLKKYFVLKGHSRLELELNVINVYNYNNIYYVDRANNEIVYQLPVLPGLRAGFTF